MANMNDAQDSTNGATSSVIPAGTYSASLVKAERKQSKSNPDNSYLNCEFQVTDGQFTGKRFFNMLNLWRSNDMAKEIADRSFNSMCAACGKIRANVQDTDELVGIPFSVELQVKTDDYGEKNVIKGGVFKPLNASSGQQQQNTGQGNDAGPWKGNQAA